ncbi:MAG: hypothetical protein R6V55_17235 [Desulfovermiculus sp.]
MRGPGRLQRPSKPRFRLQDLEEVQPEDIRLAVEKYLHPDKMVEGRLILEDSTPELDSSLSP